MRQGCTVQSRSKFVSDRGLGVRVGALRDLDPGGRGRRHGVGLGVQLGAGGGEPLLQRGLLLQHALDVGVTRRLL